MGSGTDHLILERERDAWFVIRGYGYQVDITILRWLSLRPDEALELESGEDIDAISRALHDGVWEETRLLEQVKSCSKTVTLTSAREALANFVEHRQVNAGKTRLQLKFRFTTSAMVAMEKPRVAFKDKEDAKRKEGKAGIELWREIAAGVVTGDSLTVALGQLRAAFARFTRPDRLNSKPGRKTWRGFKTFCKNADDGQLLDFVQAFEWSTGNTAPHVLGGELQRILVERDLASDSAQARMLYERLFLHVFRLLTRSGVKRLEAHHLSEVLSQELSADDTALLHRALNRLESLEKRIAAVEFRLAEHDVLLASHDQRLDRQESFTALSVGATLFGQGQILAELRAGRDEAATRHQEMLQETREARAALDSERVKTSLEGLEVSLEARIEDVRLLVESEKVKTARVLLERLRSDIGRLQGRLAHDQLLSSVCSLEGFCAWRSGDLDAAFALFYQAQRLQPQDPKALANAAYAALQQGELEEALRLSTRALEREPLHAGASSVFVRALYGLHRADEATRFLDAHSDLARTGEVAITLGSLAWESGRFEDAARHARAALRQEPDNPNAHRLLGDALFLLVDESLHGDGPLDPNEAGRNTLRESEMAFGRAIELMANWEERDLLWTALSHRATVREMLEDVDGALADCDRVLVECSDYDAALFIKGETLLRHRQPPTSAVPFLERVRHEALRPRAAFLRAQAHSLEREWEQVVAALESHYHPSGEDRGQIDFARLLLEAHHHLGYRQRVEAIGRDLETIYSGDVIALAVRAEQLEREGGRTEAAQLWEDALVGATGDRQRRMAFHVAELQVRNNNP